MTILAITYLSAVSKEQWHPPIKPPSNQPNAHYSESALFPHWVQKPVIILHRLPAQLFIPGFTARPPWLLRSFVHQPWEPIIWCDNLCSPKANKSKSHKTFSPSLFLFLLLASYTTMCPLCSQRIGHLEGMQERYQLILLPRHTATTFGVSPPFFCW